MEPVLEDLLEELALEGGIDTERMETSSVE